MTPRKIEIKKIANTQHKYQTFTKRRCGLSKKAQEACQKFDMEIGVVVISPADIPYEYDDNTRNVVDRFLKYRPYRSLSESQVQDQLGDLEAVEAQLRIILRNDSAHDSDLNLNSGSEKKSPLITSDLASVKIHILIMIPNKLNNDFRIHLNKNSKNK